MSGTIDTAKAWLAKAQNDLLNADNNLKAEHIPYDTVCFHCQQAAEKLLKAYLVANEKPYPITHDLMLLLQQVMDLNTDAAELTDALLLLVPYAVEIRYPDDSISPVAADAIEARQAAGVVCKWLEKLYPSMF